MSECKTCKHEGEICPSVSHYQGFCDGWEPKPITNADKLRTMTDEELAEWVWGAETAGRAYGPRGKNAWLGWLKREVADE